MNEREKMLLSDIQRIRVRYQDVEMYQPIRDALGELLEQYSGMCPTKLLLDDSPADDNRFEVRDRVFERWHPDVYGKVISVYGNYVRVEWDNFGTNTHQSSELELTVSDEVLL